MPSTHTSLHYHLVFSTKDRVPMIHSEWRNDLHSYLGGIVKKLEGTPLKIGGIEDHVHLLIGLKATHCLADVLRDIKKGSSEWVHNELSRKMFSWQPGYAAFTVSPTSLRSVSSYIEKQEEHHKNKSFQTEYVEMLDAGFVEYDEQYLW
jgi:putative transposase